MRRYMGRIGEDHCKRCGGRICHCDRCAVDDPAASGCERWHSARTGFRSAGIGDPVAVVFQHIDDCRGRHQLNLPFDFG